MESREGAATLASPSHQPGAATERHNATPSTFSYPDWGRKRKMEQSPMSPGKKTRLSRSQSSSDAFSVTCAKLPPVIWQNIFLYLSPITLGRLLQVNRAFHSYLTCNNVDLSPVNCSNSLRPLDSEAIWSFSRKNHFPNVPKPPLGFSEIDMWRLVLNKRCQFCHKLDQHSAVEGDSVWGRGPSLHGTRIIWAFGIRVCGACLENHVQKESELLLSPASALLPALPFAFITHDRHVVSASTIQKTAYIPLNIQLSKIYYKKHVDEIQKELEHARSLGIEAAKGWLDGLEQRGKDRLKDAERSERWDNLYPRGFHPMHNNVAAARPAKEVPAAMSLTRHPPNRSPSDTSATCADESVDTPPPTIVPLQGMYIQPAISQLANLQNSSHYHRTERSIQEVNEAKAARKADIERRCLIAISPPLHHNVLRHMESFKAAIQIPTPLTETSWELLKSRLLTQREAAEAVEASQESHISSLRAKINDHRQHEASMKEVREVLDREWEDSQKLIRDRLSRLTDEFISEKWAGGTDVNRDNSSKFAAEVLIHVRKEFYKDPIKNGEGRVDQTADPQDVSSISLESRLVLDSMKWVFDNKIKPITDPFKKDIFLCNGCESKFYGFEGVVQHYAAKHTKNFSVGNIVVHWREADWPEEPPFHPDPDNARFFSNGHATMPGAGYSHQAAYAPFHYGGYSRAGTITPQLVTPGLPLPHQASPVQFGQQTQGSHFNGPFAPPPVPPPQIAGTSYDYPGAFQSLAGQPLQPYGVPYPSVPYPPGHPPPAYGQGFPFASPGPPPPLPPLPPPHPVGFNAAMPSGAVASAVVQGIPKIPHHEADVSNKGEGNPTGQSLHSSSIIPAAESIPSVGSDVYIEQLSEISRISQLIWTILSSRPDFPLSVALYAVIHQVVDYFKLRFNAEPTLKQFIESFKSSTSTQSFLNSSGLFCRACRILAKENSEDNVIGQNTPPDQHGYTALDLFLHFNSVHLKELEPSQILQDKLDWKVDMINLPNDTVIMELIHAPGMDEEILQILAKTFPSLLHTRYAYNGLTPKSGLTVAEQVMSGRASRASDRLNVISLSSAANSGPSSIGSPQAASTRIYPRPKDEDYSPRRQFSRTETHGPSPNDGTEDHASSSLYTDRIRPLYSGVRYHDISGGRVVHEDRYSRAFEPIDNRHEGRYNIRDDFEDRRIIVRDGREIYLYRNPGSERPYHPNIRDRSVSESRQPTAEAEQQSHPSGFAEIRSQIRPIQDGEADAQRFLNNFYPNQDLQEYMHRVAEASHQNEEARTSNWSTEQESADRLRDNMQPQGHDSGRVQASDNNSGIKVEPVEPLSERPYVTPESDPSKARPVDLPSSTQRAATPGRNDPSQRRSRYPDRGGPSRYARYTRLLREEPYYEGQRLGRPRNRYGRYEAQRRRLDRERSRSPHALRERELGPHNFRDRTPDHRFTEEANIPYQTPSPQRYVSLDENSRYSAEPTTVRYRYEEVPQFAHNSYVEPVRYVRVHESYSPPRRVTSHSGTQDHLVEYVPYDRMHQDGRGIYTDNRRYVYYEQRPYDTRQDRVPFEPEPSANPPLPG